MARTIKTEKEASSKSLESTGGADGYTARLIKYIPGETIVFFVSADRIIQGYLPQIKATTETPPSQLGLWLSVGLVLFCLALTPFYLHKVVKVVNIRQIIVSTFAFLVWAFTVGTAGFNDSLNVSGPMWEMIRALLLPVFTFVAPIFAPVKKNLKEPGNA